jgi:hypothetical protein
MEVEIMYKVTGGMRADMKTMPAKKTIPQNESGADGYR